MGKTAELYLSKDPCINNFPAQVYAIQGGNTDKGAQIYVLSDIQAAIKTKMHMLLAPNQSGNV